MQAERPPLIEDGIPHGPGVLDGIHEAVRLGKTVGGVQFLAGGSAVLIERILEELRIFGLPHPAGHVDHGGGLVINQSITARTFIIIEAVGHHIS